VSRALSNETLAALIAPGVRSLAPYVPGRPISDVEREYGLTDIVKLASNENPLGPSPLAIEAMRRAIPDQMLYPDGAGTVLRRALAAHHRIDPSRITLGSGSNDILVMLAQAFLTPASNSVVSQYGFSIYALATQAMSAGIKIAPALGRTSDMPLGHDLQAIAALIDRDTRLVFVANPNNPTGTWVETAALAAFLESVPATCIAVLDEAYFEYGREHGLPDASAWLDRFANLVVCRTFSKAYGLAGLRVGYCLSDARIANVLNRVRQPFNVNGLALEAAAAALQDQQHVERVVRVAREGMAQVAAGLKRLGVRTLPSAGNFLLADLARAAVPVFENMLSQGVIVRPLAGYGLPQCVRITIGTATENERMLSVLGAALRATDAGPC
jgi:histidinol-phosphate aminotransferase